MIANLKPVARQDCLKSNTVQKHNFKEDFIRVKYW